MAIKITWALCIFIPVSIYFKNELFFWYWKISGYLWIVNLWIAYVSKVTWMLNPYLGKFIYLKFVECICWSATEYDLSWHDCIIYSSIFVNEWCLYETLWEHDIMKNMMWALACLILDGNIQNFLIFTYVRINWRLD